MGHSKKNRKGSTYQGQVASLTYIFLLTLPALINSGVAQTENDQALIVAAKEGNLEEVQLLVADGNNVNIVDDSQTTPLHWAAFLGHAEVVDFLIENGALINTFDNGGFSPLDSAAEKDHVKVARSLIKAGATIDVRNVEGRTPLYAAASVGSLSVLRLLLGAGADANTRYVPTDSTPIIIASGFGYDDIVQQLIQSGANWNATSRSGDFPLFVAAQGGHKEVVKRLIEAGVNVNRATDDGSVSLMIASQNGYAAVVKMLLDAGGRPGISNDFGDTALHKAPVKKDSPKLIKALLDAGADIDISDKRGDTPLHMAAQFGAVRSVQTLLEEAADPLLPNFDLELPEDVICECLKFVVYPNSLQCPEGTCSDKAIKNIKKLFTGNEASGSKEGKKGDSL